VKCSNGEGRNATSSLLTWGAASANKPIYWLLWPVLCTGPFETLNVSLGLTRGRVILARIGNQSGNLFLRSLMALEAHEGVL